MGRNTTPTTEEFNNYLTTHPKAKNKDIAEHFHIAPTTAAKLKSQIKKGTRPEVKGTFTNLAVKGSVKVSDLTPEDPDWWKYSVHGGGQLCIFKNDKWLIRREVNDAMVNLKNKYPEQLPAVKSQITAFYDQFRHGNSPDMTLEEFNAVIRGLVRMMKVEAVDVDARFGNRRRIY